MTGPLQGIPVIVKDQMDAKGMPTTLGSILFQNYFPDRDSFVAEKLRKAGAIILAKTTLGELGGGDTHGSCLAPRKSLWARPNRRRLVWRIWRGYFRKLRDGRNRPGSICFDSPARDLELRSGDPADRRSGQPKRRI